MYKYVSTRDKLSKMTHPSPVKITQDPHSRRDLLPQLVLTPNRDILIRHRLIKLDAFPSPQHQQLKEERRSRSLRRLVHGISFSFSRSAAAHLLRNFLKLDHLVLLLDRLELPSQ